MKTEIIFQGKNRIVTPFGRIRLDNRIDTGYKLSTGCIFYDTALPQPNVVLVKPGVHFKGGKYEWAYNKGLRKYERKWVDTPVSKYKYAVICLNAMSPTSEEIDVNKRTNLYWIYLHTDDRKAVDKLFRKYIDMGRFKPKWQL